jgi:hypothetical protein
MLLRKLQSDARGSWANDHNCEVALALAAGRELIY